jgi:hypothetical protein
MRAALGQVSAAQGHLRKRNVGVGDLFLFSGLFRTAVRNRDSGRWRFQGAAEHRVFGWLQVAEVIAAGRDVEASRARFPELRDHPHLFGSRSDCNTIYLAAHTLTLPNSADLCVPGAGLLTLGHRLTADGRAPRLG